MNKKTKAGVIAAVAGAMGVSGVAHMDAIKHAVKKQSDITAETKIPVLSSLLQSKKSTEARGVTTTSDVARKIVKRAGAAMPQRTTPAKHAAAKATTPASEMQVAFSSDSAAPVVTVAASSEATSDSATSTKAAKSATTEQTAAASSASDVLTSVAASSASEKRAASVSAAPVTPA